MGRLDQRILIGVGLVVLGGLLFLERLGLFQRALDVFWGGLLLLAGAYFLYRFASDPRENWWAVIPGTALAGLAAESLWPRQLGDLGGMFFLGGLGLGFLAVYLSNRQRWWAIIPAGVLLTLALVSLLTEQLAIRETGSFLFAGLGITFLAVAIFARQRWAYVPGIVLLAMGALIGSTYAGALEFLWPAALVVCGLILIWRFARRT